MADNEREPPPPDSPEPDKEGEEDKTGTGPPKSPYTTEELELAVRLPRWMELEGQPEDKVLERLGLDVLPPPEDLQCLMFEYVTRRVEETSMISR